MPRESDSLSEYLRARRALVRPEEVGYPTDPRRRVSGLRREEVAVLAGISLEYYVRLEQGNVRYHISESVLKRLAFALRLDEEASAYLYRLALPAPLVEARNEALGDLTRYLVEQWSNFPVYVHDRKLDVLIANDFAMRIFPLLSLLDNNLAKATFMAPPEGRAMPAWKAAARELTGALRYYGDPSDARMRAIVEELSGDADFARLWAAFDARPLSHGTSPVFVDGLGVGDVPWQSLAIPGGCFLIVHLAPPNTFAADVFDHYKANRVDGVPITEFDGSATVPALDAASVLAEFERVRVASLNTGGG